VANLEKKFFGEARDADKQVWILLVGYLGAKGVILGFAQKTL
jgi:hypothetical protein